MRSQRQTPSEALRLRGAAKAAAVICLAATLPGCIILPLWERRSPEIVGFVHDNGRPVANLEVRVSSGDNENVAITDEKGLFKLGPIVELRVGLPISDQRYRFALTVDTEGKRHQVFSMQAFRYAPPSRLTMDCDLSKLAESYSHPRVTRASDRGDVGLGICNFNPIQ